MSLLGFDGFSVYRTLDEIEEQYWVIETNENAKLSLDPNAGQNERGGLKVNAGLPTKQSAVYFDLVAAKTELMLGFWFTFDGFDTSGGDTYDGFLTFQSSTTTRCHFRIQQDGRLTFRRSTGSTEYFDSGDAAETATGKAEYLYQGSEYKIEIRISLINTTGSMQIWVNDVLWFEGLNNLDLDGTANRIYFKSAVLGTGAEYTISDFYCLEVDGTAPEERLGASWQVEVLRPTADSGTENDWTASTGIDEYAMVDEAPRHDADATYNSSSVATNIDRYTTTNTLNGARVIAAKVNAVARHEGAAENFRLTIFENVTAGNGGTEAITENYLPYWYTTTVNPDTSAEWTKAELEGCEFGVEDVA